jgi:hypothetical protein
VTQGCRFRLAAACVGDLIELEHPAIESWLADQKAKGKKRKTPDETSRRELRAKADAKKHVGRPAAKAKGGRTRRPGAASAKPEPAPALDGSGFAEEIMELTLREVAERFGTHRQYIHWLDAYAKREQARKSRLANEQTERSLIEREFVETHVFAIIDALFRRLLTDAARTISSRLSTMVKAGAPIEKCEREAREQISKQLRAIRTKVTKALQKASVVHE